MTDCWVRDSTFLPPIAGGVLDGVAVAVKDLISIQGHVSSFGHARWRESHAPSKITAPVLSALLSAGARVAGLTTMDQLAYSLVGNVGEGRPPTNPLYPDRFTGGSSSGTAAAVASAAADLGIGTDTAGSIRVPAASCGLFGLRPTHGVVDTTGVVPLAPSFDVVGLLAREPSVLAAAARVISGTGQRPASSVREVRVPTDCLTRVSPIVADAVLQAAKTIGAVAGAPVVDARFGWFTSSDAADLFARIQGREIWSQHAGWVAEYRDWLADDVRGRLDRAERLSGSALGDKLADEAARAEYRRRYLEFVRPDTVIALPVLRHLAPHRSASADELQSFRSEVFRLAVPSSLTGSPQLVMPVRHLATGDHFGVGLLAAHGADGMLVNLATRCAQLGSPLPV